MPISHCLIWIVFRKLKLKCDPVFKDIQYMLYASHAAYCYCLVFVTAKMKSALLPWKWFPYFYFAGHLSVISYMSILHNHMLKWIETFILSVFSHLDELHVHEHSYMCRSELLYRTTLRQQSSKSQVSLVAMSPFYVVFHVLNEQMFV